MKVYLDTSVVLRRLLNEPNQIPDWGRWKVAYASRIWLTEAQRTVDRLRREGRLGDEEVVRFREDVLKADCMPPLDVTKRLHAKVKTLWEEERGRLPRPHERYTCSAFLEPLLADPGWLSLPEKSLSFGQFTRKRPDFCLFTAADARNTAAASAEPARVFSLASTVLEAKQFGHPLDRVSKTETKGWFPSQQIQD